MDRPEVSEGAAIKAAEFYSLMTDFKAVAKFDTENGWHAMAENALGHPALPVVHDDEIHVVPLIEIGARGDGLTLVR